MKRLCGYILGASIGWMTVATGAVAETTIVDALQASDTKLHWRLRYEDVSQTGIEDANALTMLSRLTFTSGHYQGFSLTLEMDDVTAITNVDYNDGTGINTDTAVIVDPEGTEVNQAYLAYQNFGTTFKYGRQRILLDNQRFVGGVGWRQNEQTYDAVTATNKSFDDLTLFYAYVHNVNRIFGENSPQGDHKQQTHLLNARYTGWQAGALIGYAYLIDNETASALASDTYGVRWEGKISDSLSYNLEYATQSDAGDSPADYSVDYLLVEGKAKVQAFNFTGGYEVLGSDDGVAAFSTPFATLHAFQGWTDKFLVTPAAGVEDAYISAATNIGGIAVSLVYHDLSANEGSMSYGSEIGLAAGRKVGPVGLTLKYADYNADEFLTDTRKVWLMAAGTF